ncbi:MAG: hypothetical protein Ta2A_17450 [Treponemataceae bacterium]|nr:MAG: hypothetical protein Ta2A_17450 [Treponemataceae bacterium]
MTIFSHPPWSLLRKLHGGQVLLAAIATPRQRGTVGRCARSRPGTTTSPEFVQANSWLHGRAVVLILSR